MIEEDGLGIPMNTIPEVDIHLKKKGCLKIPREGELHRLYLLQDKK